MTNKERTTIRLDKSKKEWIREKFGNISHYIRKLIDQDLKRRGVLKEEIKQKLRQNERKR